MRNVYTTLLLIFAAAIFICSCVIGRRDKRPLTKAIRYIMIAAPCTMAAYAAALIAPALFTAELLYAIYYTVSDVLLICMLLYALKYTNVYEMRLVQKVILYSIVAVDGVLMLLNVFTEKIFIFRCGLMEDSGTFFYGIAERGGLYNFHRFIIYGMVVLIVLPLVVKIVKSPAMYRKKFWLTLISLLIIIAANVLYLVMELEIDFSVLTYGIMALAIYYFNVIYVPQGLVEGLLSSSIKNMDDSVICFDLEGNCVYANSVAYGFFKAESSAPFEDYYREWMKGRRLADAEDAEWKETREINSAKRYYDVSFKRLCDSNDNCVGCFFKMHDETVEVEKLAAERFRATHDRLTGIYNKEHFYDVVADVVREAEPGSYCMVCSDIKNFKLVNDIFGINIGDEVLINIADTLKRMAGSGSVFGRISGDRFAICMPRERFNPEVFSNEIRRIGEKSGTSTYRICMHVGVYDIVDRDIAVSVMCDRAYMAIKTIKSSLTDTIAHYDEGIRESTVSEQKLTGEFGGALEEGQFCFYIQPQVSVRGKILGGEALVRWIHPERGLVPPVEFIGILENTGLICKLDMYIWEQACRKLREWKDRGLTDYHISVNISPKDFYFADIYKVFTGLVEKYELKPRNLRLEITESAIMSDFEKQLVLIQRLQEYGFLVEMDDFGSGYSSLNMLKDMPVNTLKVDMGFLRQTNHQERSRTILKMIISLSKQLGMEVITEGVETREQVDFLTDIGCDIFQGYYFAKPMPVSEFEQKYFDR
ncbi:MAG: EAL domain-containing protein [Butyrivibrio sp.]|nr:EAL domain-containing protein [Acetatifactor muris]MCM1560419.1 EAL domain-containing protein [Butyrivibrio sp.]